MTVQFKVEWNGYDAGGVYTLSAPEEARLIAAGIAFNYVPVSQVAAGLTSAQLAAGAVAPAAVSSTGSILGADGSPVSGAAASADLINDLTRWFRGGIAGKKIVLSGDSTMLDTSGGLVSRLQYLGAAIRRDYLGTSISQSGNTVTSSGVIFFPQDVGATINFGNGQTGTITAYTSAFVVQVSNSQTYAGSAYILRNGAFAGNDGAPMAGVTVYHCGDNGQTAQGHIGGSGAYSLAYIASLMADLYVSGFGINDVRSGGTTQAQLQARLETIYDTLAAANTNAHIMFRVPNPMLSTDPGATGYVTPLASAQDYSDRMAGAYRALAVSRPKAYVWDTRKTVWGGDTCPATSSLMGDILHPNQLANVRLADDLSSRTGLPVQFQRAQADAAFVANPTAPYSVYPLILQDGRYFDTLLSGVVNGSGAGYIDISLDSLREASNSVVGDIIYQDGVAPFVATATGGRQSNGIMRVLMTAPSTLTVGARIRIFRQRGFGDANIMSFLASPAQFPFAVPVSVVAAGSGFVYIGHFESGDTRLNDIQAADTLVIQGVAPLVLTGATFGTQLADGSGYVTITQGGDKSAMAGKKGYLFGAARNGFRTVGVPVIPRDGQVWYDPASGGSLKVRLGGVTKTVTVA